MSENGFVISITALAGPSKAKDGVFRAQELQPSGLGVHQSDEVCVELLDVRDDYAWRPLCSLVVSCGELEI